MIALYRVAPEFAAGEADLSSLPSSPALARTHFAYPRIIDRFQKTMDFAIPIHSTDWATGAYGLLEPRHELPAVHRDDLEILLIPGVVFGEKGERLGRGAGYYDRFLADLPRALRIGIAFDFQVISEEIPQEPWDARMDLIVTETRIIEVSEKT